MAVRATSYPDYGALDVEELGSVYESLLDFAPYFSEQDGKLTFDFGYGTERKSTGSYYTPHELVSELIKSALVPVLEDRLKSVKTKKEKEKAILSLKVCDPAAGSGHFLLAATRRLGRELAKIRTGDDEPAPEQMRLAVRDCITHCIYGVDKNPLAVDLCKVSLWIEGHAEGKPLTFLDHRIRCGDSLIGVMHLDVLREGIPDAAYKPMVGDDKVVARSVKQQNRQQRMGQRTLPFRSKAELQSLTQDRSLLMKLADDTPDQIRRKAEAYRKSQSKGTKWWQDNTACHLWTAAFFAELTQKAFRNSRIPTTDTLHRYLDTHSIDGRFTGTAWALAQRHRFFHWPLEFSEVFTLDGDEGFDCVLGNPPWERIKLQEKEFFAQKDPEIATAPNAAARKKLIARLPETNLTLWAEFLQAKRTSECESNFMRSSGRYPLSAVGDINTYQIFAGLARQLVCTNGRAGIVIPSGIATDDSNKKFFSDLVEKRALVSLYDFENREGIFGDVHRSYKFCLLTAGGTNSSPKGSDFAFFLTNVGQMKDEDRHFALSAEDIALLNPNTRTCPMFRTKRDGEITKAIHTNFPVLIKEGSPEENPWGAYYIRLIHYGDYAEQLYDAGRASSECFLRDENKWQKQGETLLPVYESKLIHSFDHRFASYDDNGRVEDVPISLRHDPFSFVTPRYWVQKSFFDDLMSKYSYQLEWFLAYRDVVRSTDVRTVLATVIPKLPASVKLPILGFNDELPGYLLAANFNSFAFDYVARQSVGGISLSFFILKQLPVIPPSAYDKPCLWDHNQGETDVASWLTPRVLELIYTSNDLEAFAHDCGYRGPVFRWNDYRRFLIRCELDAAFFHLYSTERHDVDYIMDTFPIVKRKDEQKYGEYRTKRVILECYDAMAEAMETGRPYQTILDPPPADPRVAHSAKGV